MSALRYWRSSTPYGGVDLHAISRVRSMGNEALSSSAIKAIRPKEYGFIMSGEYPLDLLVPASDARRRISCTKQHIWNHPFSYNAFRRVSDDILVSTPEFVFVQLAQTLEFVELVRLGVELCGHYSLRHEDGYDERTPLTSKAKLLAFLKRAGDVRGYKRATEALAYIADGSASPQETNVLLALCLPRRCGGYWFPLPQLNPKIQVSERLRSYVNGTFYYPDFMWTKKDEHRTIKITAEYDSHDMHDLEADAERTRIRRNAFKTMGFLVTSINRSQLRSADWFEYPARQIARDLGLRRNRADLVTLSKRDELLQKLRYERIR